MRILVLAMCLMVAAPLTVQGQARALEVVGVIPADGWLIYGAKTRFVREAGGPPGGGAAIVEATETAEPWSSGAVAVFNGAAKAGETYTAVYWLRAPAGAKVSALLLTNAPPYPTFAQAEVAGAGDWKRMTITGVAKADAAPVADALTLHLGRADGPVALGPAVILRGTPSAAELDAIESEYGPARIAEDVTITASDGVALAATLRTPGGRGPFPAVLLLGGSGPQVRGGFQRVQDRLLAAGVAVIEYDKRGCGQSTGERIESVSRLAADAEAAVAFLRTRSRIDPARIAVLGSSQGGVIAPVVAVEDKRLRGVVIQVAPAVAGTWTVSDQVARQMVMQWPQGGSYEDQRRFMDTLVALIMANRDPTVRRAKLAEAIAAGVKVGRIPPDAAEPMVAGLTDAAVRPDFLAYDPAKTLRRLKGPALLVYGTKDIAVSSARNAPIARAALKDNPQATVVEFEGLNHFLQRTKTNDLEEWRTLGGMMSDPTALDYIVAWLEKTLKA